VLFVDLAVLAMDGSDEEIPGIKLNAGLSCQDFNYPAGLGVSSLAANQVLPAFFEEH